MKIRFIHPASTRLTFKPGDEITVSESSPEVVALLASSRVDGQRVAQLVEDEEKLEYATTGRGRQRSPAVS